MNYIYNFNETNIPFWIKALYWVLYVIPFLFLCGKIIYKNKKIKFPKAVITYICVFFSALFTVLFCIFFDYLYWSLFILPFLFLLVKTLYKEKMFPKTITTYIFLFYFTLFAVFYCINSDYFAYRDWIDGRDFAIWTKEQIYVLIILLCKLIPTNYPYEVFRLIVWGGAIILVYFSARRYRENLNPGLVVLFLFVLFSSTFCYARASLAMSVFFAGLSLFFYAQGRLQKILSIMLAVSSFFFHHEMIVGIALLPCLFIPFENKKTRIFILVSFVIGLVVISYLLSNPQIVDMLFGNDDMSNKIDNFNDKEGGAFRLSTFVNYFKYYLLLFLFSIYLKKQNETENFILGLYRITFGILLVATIFIIVAGARSTYTYRILYISMIPLSIMLGYFYSKGYVKKQHMVIILIFALLSNSVRFINS